MGVLTPVAEQLAKPFPHAIALLTLDDVASSSHKKLPAGYILFFSSECWRKYSLALGSYSWALLSLAFLESEVLFSFRYTCCSNTTWWWTTRAAGLAENCGCHNVACILTWGWEEVKPCAGLPQVGLQLSHLLCLCHDQERREESTFPYALESWIANGMWMLIPGLASCRLFEYLESNDLNFPVIHHLKFPSKTER